MKQSPAKAKTVSKPVAASAAQEAAKKSSVSPSKALGTRSSAKVVAAKEEKKSTIVPLPKVASVPLPSAPRAPDASFLASLRSQLVEHQAKIMAKCAATGTDQKS